MFAGFADPSRKGTRDWLRALFAEAKRRMRRRRRRQLAATVITLLAAGALVVVLSGGSGGGASPSAGQSVNAQLAARLQVAETEVHNSLNPLGSTPSLSQLKANFAVLRRPQTEADRSWHPDCSCAGSATQLGGLTRFAVNLPHGYRVFLDVERFIAGGQLNTPAGSYMMNLDFVDRYGNTDSTSFGANTQYTVDPLSTARPGPSSARSAGGAGFASIVPDGVAKVSWTFGCPRGGRAPDGVKAGQSMTVVVPVVNNVAAIWLAKEPADCAGATKVVWLGTNGHTVTAFHSDGNLVAPPFIKGKLRHGTARLLTSSSIGNAHIGTSSASALAALNKQFGSPADSNVLVHGCASDRESVWTSPAVAVPLTVFTDNGRFVGYQYGADGGDPGNGPGAVLETSGGLTLGSEIRTVREIYPTGYESASSSNVGYWSVSSAGSRFYGTATPDRYPGRTVAPADRISTIGAGSFPTCATLTQPTRGPVLAKPGPHASPRTLARYYVAEANRQATQEGSCVASNTAVPKTEPGSPSPSLLAELAVLRTSTTSSDTLPRSLRGNAPRARFVKYIRLARTVDGLSYYIVPSAFATRLFGALNGRCITAANAALHSEERTIPSAARTRTLALATQTFQQERLILKRETGDGVCLLFAKHQESGGTCGATTADLRKWGLTSTMGQIAGIVPDGVSSVIVHVPAYEGQHAITAHATVVNNLFATSIQETFGNRRQPTIVWLSASGKTVRTVPARIDGVADSGWCGGCG
jgi:hypothetical protein